MPSVPYRFATRVTFLPSLVLAVITTTCATLAIAANEPSRAEQQIRYRQSLFNVMGANFASLGAMADGKAPYDAQQFAIRARRVDFIAQMLGEAFPPESSKGAPTDAKAEIWTQRQEFQRLLKDLQSKSTQLSKGSFKDAKASRPAFLAVAEACGACHDKFVVKRE